MYSGMCFQANCISCGSLLSVKWTSQINKVWTFACSLLLCLIWTHSAFFYLGISINQHGVYRYIYIYINWYPQTPDRNIYIYILYEYINIPIICIYIYIGVVEKYITCACSRTTQKVWHTASVSRFRIDPADVVQLHMGVGWTRNDVRIEVPYYW